MKKLSDLYQANQFFEAMRTAHLLPACEWVNGISLMDLDAYLWLSARNKQVFTDVYPDTVDVDVAYTNIRAILTAYTYKLDGLYNSMLLEYDPLVNYDKTEIQTHNEKVSTDDHVTTNDLGARSQTNRDKTTSFDSADYGKATDEGNISSAAAIDVTTQAAYEDNSNGGYNLTVKGNIGVTTSQQMLESEREVKNFNFYNEILRIFYDTILYSGWEV